MPPDTPVSVRGRQLQALRAAAENPNGLRHEAYPSAMPALQELGLVEARPARGPGRKVPAWFITPEGRQHLARIDAGRPGIRRQG